jgi:hypothetical protein
MDLNKTEYEDVDLTLRPKISALLYSNRSYSIAACVLVAEGTCLLSPCLTVNVYSNFAFPAFGPHVTI